MTSHPILCVFFYIALLVSTSVLIEIYHLSSHHYRELSVYSWHYSLDSCIASTIGELIGFARAKYMTHDLVKVSIHAKLSDCTCRGCGHCTDFITSDDTGETELSFTIWLWGNQI
jgi:hypothetical protein